MFVSNDTLFKVGLLFYCGTLTRSELFFLRLDTLSCYGLLKLDGTLNCFGLLISDGALFIDGLFFVMVLDLYYDKLSSSLTCISIIPSLFAPVPFTVPQILSPHVLPSSK